MSIKDQFRSLQQDARLASNVNALRVVKNRAEGLKNSIVSSPNTTTAQKRTARQEFKRTLGAIRKRQREIR